MLPTKKTIYPIILAGIILISFFLMGLFYINNTARVLNENMQRQLMEIADQGKRRLEDNITNNLTMMNTFTTELTKENLSEEDVTVSRQLDIIKQQTKKSGFVRFSYISTDGTALTSDNSNIYLGNEEYFKHSINGEEYIAIDPSERVGYEGNTVIVLSVPIRNHGKIEGVLAGTYLLNRLTDNLNIKFFDGLGYSYVINNEGKIIVHPYKEYIGKNLYSLLQSDNTDETINYVKEDLLSNKNGLTYIKINGLNKTVAYSKIAILNNWNFISTLPAGVAMDELSSFKKISSYLTMLLGILFVVLVYYIIVSTYKNKEIIYNLAYVDNITNIYNLNKFKLETYNLLNKRGDKKYALIGFDIDIFKLINETFGYDFGDCILKIIAEALKSEFKDSIFARIQSDHFVVLLEYEKEEEIVNAINNFFENFYRRKITNDIRVDVVLSSGVYLIPEDETLPDVRTMISYAYTAAKTVKGINSEVKYAFFDSNIRNQMVEEVKLEKEIKMALEKKQFRVFYQPKISLLNDNKISGAEALLRWIHPDRGFISPMEFIPVAEKTQLIVMIGRFVFEEVCKTISQWEKDYKYVYPISVNFSMIELYQSDLIDFIKYMIAKYDLNPKYLEIEITESSALGDLKYVVQVINELKSFGIKVSMDDFGTGYSSLSYLKNIPISILKLDKSFFNKFKTDHRSKNIMKSVIELAKSLNLIIVSEGVETKAQVEFLVECGCHQAQGFYFSRPIPQNEFEQLIFNNQED